MVSQTDGATVCSTVAIPNNADNPNNPTCNSKSVGTCGVGVAEAALQLFIFGCQLQQHAHTQHNRGGVNTHTGVHIGGVTLVLVLSASSSLEVCA